MTKNSGNAWVMSTTGALLAAVTADGDVVQPEKEPVLSPDTTGFSFASTFQGEDALESGEWVLSEEDKYKSQGEHVSVAGCDLEGDAFAADKGLLLEKSHEHYAIGATLAKPFDNKGKDLVMQYEVQMRNGAGCGGAYVKMLRSPAGEDMTALKNDSQYSIMFGPDKCFRDTNKVHFIFQHQHPVTKEWEEKHFQSAPKIKDDKGFHLYTLHVKADNTFEIFVDAESAAKGSLLEDFEPAVNPPKEIEDPDDAQPDDWVTKKRIPDPDATKPYDWDEDAPRLIVDESAEMPEGWLEDAEESIPDPHSTKPANWDDEEDGEWEPVTIPNPACLEAPGCGKWTKPKIPNPSYKGPWKAPMIDNPDYKGPWAPRKIENPGYYEDPQPSNMAPITGLAVEIWTVDGGVWLDNVVLGHDIDAALQLAEQTWRPKFETFEAKVAEEKKKASDKRKERKNKRNKSGSTLLSTTRAMVDKARPYLPESAAPALDAVGENPLACLGTIMAILVGVVLLFSTRRGKPSAGSHRASTAASVPTSEPSPEVTADGVSGDAGVEERKGQLPEEEEEDEAAEKADGAAEGAAETEVEKTGADDKVQSAAPPSEPAVPAASTS